ncbi:ribosomal protection-like ABC-F family protein [Desmospora activa]|uniref:ATPase subunit of ABC transporter with duplicated ATPase domains n=1 Tax=Desmospora activa DSM 45169 TaxID=1121389 RepID=A0A2T4Z760_9BACL|nr:ABC-F type ribosomal protection protein [Desmospora activa]PTM57710.1 ATPase subunit of ABC transporter with duplicated ATPase domains [Desmospora activa DSM 45169]
MIVCAANRVGKMWGGNWIFQDLSLEIREGERIGLVGPNGCGKSTLLRLLSGEDPPDQGDLFYGKGVQVGYLRQIPVQDEEKRVEQVLRSAFADLIDLGRKMEQLETEMSDPTLSTQELERILNRYQSCQEEWERRGGYEMEAKMERVVQGLHLPSGMLESPFHRLSGGEKTKVELGRVLLQEPELLLLDEPTNHLDLRAMEWLEETIRQHRGAVVVVSHDRYFLDRIATAIVDLENGECVRYPDCGYTAFVKRKEERLLAEFHAYQEQQKKIKKMKEAIKRLRQWAHQGDNEKMYRRAASMEKALERIEKIQRPQLERKKIDLTFAVGERSGQEVFRCQEVYKEFGERTVLEDVNLQIRFGEKAAIIGENGSGKSTLLKILLGEMEPDLGDAVQGPSVHVGYLSQQGWEGDGETTVVDAFREEVAVDEGKARQLLARFLFYGYAVFRKVKDLSGGERMRLRLAQLMHQDLNALVLDEPTNHLDIDSREVLEEALAEFPGSIIAVSHDRYFLNKLFAPTYWLQQGTLTRFEGNYDEMKAEWKRRGIGAE